MLMVWLKSELNFLRCHSYFWIGQNSTIDEQGAVAHHVTKMDTEAGGNAKQIRVVQGKEPQHLQHIFKHLVIYRYVTKH